MRTCWIILVTVMLGVGCRKAPPSPPPPPEVLARWHFAGSEAVEATTNGSAVKAILALPESKALLEQTLDKLVRAPYARLKSGIHASTNDCAELLRPLFDDLTRAESYFELRAASNRPTEWTLAVRLAPARAEVWRTNLATTLSLWTGQRPSNAAPAGLTGWRLRKHDAPDHVGLTVAPGWVLFGAGLGGLPLQDELAARVQAQGRPVPATTNYWFQVMVDWPRFADLPRWLAALRLPKADLTLAPRGDNLRAQAELLLPQPLNWKPEPWRFPTNAIHDPVVGFAAIQGFGEWLKPILDALGVKLDGVPNQACLWALQGVPFQTFIAAPVTEATNVMDQLRERLPPWFSTNTAGHVLGSWRPVTNTHAIFWDGMPFFGGFMSTAIEETNEGFIIAGLFPNTTNPQPPPPELYFQVLGRTNLAYYDWEIGAERLAAWRTMVQLAHVLAEKPILLPEAAAAKWMDAIGPKLGNIGTSLTVNGPDRMTLIRQSPHGFTGFETVLLAHWLESTNFPWGYRLPAPQPITTNAAPLNPNP